MFSHSPFYMEGFAPSSRPRAHALTSLLLLTVLTLCSACLSTTGKAPSPTRLELELQDRLSQATSERADATRAELLASAERDWSRRSQYEHLLASIVTLERASDTIARPFASDHDRQEYLTLATRRARAYHLVGLIDSPPRDVVDESGRREALKAFELGAATAVVALEALLGEAAAAALVSEPTDARLASLPEQTYPLLFWYAMNLQDAAIISRGYRFVQHREVIQKFLEFLAWRQPAMERGAVHAALGVFHARHGQGGGNPMKSRAAFERSLELCPNNLMFHVMYAEHYAVLIQDRALFERQLTFALETSPTLMSEASEENKVAVARAVALRAVTDVLFY